MDAWNVVKCFQVSVVSALLLALVLASFSYALMRFEQLQRAAWELSQSSEAFYTKARIARCAMLFAVS